MAKNKIDDLINMDYNALVELTRAENKSQLISVVKTMTRASNRRLRELDTSDIGQYSPAYMNLKESGKKRFSENYSKMSHNDLLHQFGETKKFLSAKSSTLKGWNEIRGNIRKRLATNKATGEINEKSLKRMKLFKSEYKSERSAKIWHNREQRFWKLYNRLVNEYGAILTQLDSNRIQEILSNVQLSRNEAKSDDDIIQAMNVLVQNLYYDSKYDVDAFLEDIKTVEGMDEVRLEYGMLQD